MGSVNLSLEEYFSDLEDPRLERSKKHQLLDIIVISICGTICGMESWVEMEDFGNTRKDWFSKFLDLEHGIPSHDTFRRVFSLIDPKAFQKCFLTWVEALCSSCEEKHVAIDGKTLRRSFDKVSDKPALHLVSAWSASNNFVLGQVAVDDKSNEIVAIPKLLDILAARGCIFTMDAMGCQKSITEKIVDKKADYVLCLKENHPNLYAEAQRFFEDSSNVKYIDEYEKTEADHGRIERRKCLSASANLFKKIDGWVGVESVSMIEAEREINGKVSLEKRYFISSLRNEADKIATAVRSHWGIENSLHWVLDMNLNEDQCRIRDKNAAENFAMMRRMTVGLLKNENSTKKSIKRKIQFACMKEDYILTVLQANVKK